MVVVPRRLPAPDRPRELTSPRPRPLRAGVYVGAAVFRGETLLALRRVDAPKGRWDLPGGSVHAGETLSEALRRELREETGLAPAIHDPFHVSSFRVRTSDGTVPMVAIEFLATDRGRRTVRLAPEEHDRSSWVRSADLGRYAWAPGFRAIARSAFRARRRRAT